MDIQVANNNKKEPANTIFSVVMHRFGEYGYNKTTMAEIARDANMSAANIYRYFRNKEAIAVTCVTNIMRERIELLNSVVNEPGLSAVSKLEKYIMTTLEATQSKANENKKIDEICTEITKHRPDIVHDKIKAEVKLISEILQYGNNTGEFNVINIDQTASSIHAMLVVFDVPMFMHLYSEEEFEQKARSAVNILVAGICNRE